MQQARGSGSPEKAKHIADSVSLQSLKLFERGHRTQEICPLAPARYQME